MVRAEPMTEASGSPFTEMKKRLPAADWAAVFVAYESPVFVCGGTCAMSCPGGLVAHEARVRSISPDHGLSAFGMIDVTYFALTPTSGVPRLTAGENAGG